MRISIRKKLITTYLFISVFTALLIYLFTYFTSEQRIKVLTLDYQTSEMIQEAQQWYASEKSWQGFATYFKSIHPPKKGSNNNILSAASDKTKKHSIVDQDRRALLNYLQYKPGDIVPMAHLSKAKPILVEGQTVGWILPPEAVGISLSSEMSVFFENVHEVLVMSVAISVACSLIMGVILARMVLKPVESITRASIDIANGKLAQKVNRYSDDEMGDLSQAFNKMSADLVKAEQQRKHLTADITHDLATPVQVISGYIEMAQEEGELRPDRVDIIASELEQINRLLKDMALLAQTDAKILSLQLMPTDINAVLTHIVKLYQKVCEDKSIQLSLQCDADIPKVQLDTERIIQVLGNLLTNALRYTPEKGTITIDATAIKDWLTITIADTGCGINAKDLPYIFGRFYRSSDDRTETSGKMGLGLAISKGLIEMHGGSITAQSKQNGASFIIRLPINQHV